MLGEHLIHPVLLATDLGAAKDFYHGRLGLKILNESDAAIVFGCGGGTQLAVTKSTTGTADTQTQASWLVKDVRAEVAELRSRGVKIEEYDLPGLKTQDGAPTSGSPGQRSSSTRARTRWASSRSRSEGSQSAFRLAMEMVLLARPCWLWVMSTDQEKAHGR